MPEENERFKKMVEDSQDWFWEFDENANFTYASPQIRELLGYEPEELIGVNAFDLMDEEEARRVHEHFDPIAKKYLPFKCLININTHRDGHQVVIESSGTPIFDDDGCFRGYRGIDRDVTESKRIEESLRLSEEKLNNIVTLLPQSIYETDFDGRVVFANRAAFELFGYSEGDFAAGVNILDMIIPEDLVRARENILRLYAGASQGNNEYLARRKDGTVFPVLIYSDVVRKDGSPVGLRGVVVDISKRKKYEQELEASRDLAEKANRAKDEFLANMSHELRTPITAIVGFVDLLLETALSEQQQRYLGTIASSTETLLALVNDLLDLARIEAGKVYLERKEFGIRTLVGEVADSQKPAAKAKGLFFQTRVSAEVPDRLMGDPLRLKQVLLNLSVNAIKFSEVGEVSLSVSVDAVHPTTPLLCFDVADTGIGMRAEDIAEIFEPFSQLDPSSTRKFGGAGLGLAICTKLLAIMGGEIAVDSREGVGSIFHVRLPFEVAGMARVSEGSPSSGNLARMGGHPLRVLLVEDHEVSQYFFAEVLRHCGHHVDLTDNGAEALGKLECCVYDLVLMDVQMPVMDGLEAIRKIREREMVEGGHLPVIALTAHAMEKDRLEMLSKGFDGYVSKPMKIKELLDEVERCLLIHR